MLNMWIFDKKHQRRFFMHMEMHRENFLKRSKNLKVGFNLDFVGNLVVILFYF